MEKTSNKSSLLAKKTPRYRAPYPTTTDETFHPFPKLPKELRDKIWDHSIQNRKSEPLAHFFTLRSGLDFKHCQLCQVNANGSMSWENVRSHFAQPRKMGDHFGGRDHAWSKTFDGYPDNRSGHLLDSGLWGACVESRAAVVRRWKLHHGLNCCLGYNFSDHNDRCPGPDAGSDFTSADQVTKAAHRPCQHQSKFHLKNPYRVTILRAQYEGLPGERWIVTRPETDLFVCDLQHLQRFRGRELDFLQLSTENDQFIANVGIEYRHWWNSTSLCLERNWQQQVDLHTPSGGFLRLVDHAINTVSPMISIHLIDYDLKPIKGETLETLVEDRKVYRAQGQRFIEVRRWDVGHTWTVGMNPRSVEHMRQDVHPRLEDLIRTGESRYYFDDDGWHLRAEDDPVRKRAQTFFESIMVLAVLQDNYVPQKDDETLDDIQGQFA